MSKRSSAAVTPPTSEARLTAAAKPDDQEDRVSGGAPGCHGMGAFLAAARSCIVHLARGGSECTNRLKRSAGGIICTIWQGCSAWHDACILRVGLDETAT